MTTKRIISFRTAASLTDDAASIALEFEDGTRHEASGLPPARFAAVVAVLQGASEAFFTFAAAGRSHYVSSAEDYPGPA